MILMSNPFRPRLALGLALLTLLSGCVTPSAPRIQHSPQPLLTSAPVVVADPATPEKCQEAIRRLSPPAVYVAECS